LGLFLIGDSILIFRYDTKSSEAKLACSVMTTPTNSDNPGATDLTVEQQNEANKLNAIDLAEKIYNVLCDPDMVKVKPETRHSLVARKYPNFAQAYPVILRYMARNLRYNSRAFRQFLDRLEREPGSGMEGYIENQARYARFLYIESMRDARKHVNMKIADNVFNSEYTAMMQSYKKIKDEEAKARNEFEDEKQQNLIELRQELLDFVEAIDRSESAAPLDPMLEDAQRLKWNLPLQNPKPTFADIKIDMLQLPELRALYQELIKFLNEKELVIIGLEGAQDPRGERMVEDRSGQYEGEGALEELQDEYYRLIQIIPVKDEKIRRLREAAAAAAELARAKVVKQRPVKTRKEREDERAERMEWLKGTNALPARKSRRGRK
jgi:hypothetical protein